MNHPEQHPSGDEPTVRVRGPGPRPGPKGKTRHLILAHVLVVITVLVYAGSVNNQFVLRDDAAIVENRWVRSLSAAPGFFLPSFWRAEMGGRLSGYRPVVLLSYAADFSVWKKDALGFHLTNLIIHSLAAVAFFFLARRMVGDDGLAFLGGLLFALHPLATEAVCYLAQRGTLLAWALSLAAWLAWWRSWQDASGRERRALRKGLYAVALVLQGLGVGSAPAAALLPLFQGGTVAYTEKDKARRRGLWMGLVPFALLSLLGLALHGVGARAGEPLFASGEAAPGLLSGLGSTVASGVRLALFPVHLVAGRPLAEAASPWAGLALLALAGVLILRSRGRYRKTLFGLTVAGSALVPALVSVVLLGGAWGEHHLYGLAAAFSLVLMGLLHDTSSLRRERNPASRGPANLMLASVVAVGVLFAVLTAGRHMEWESPWTIARATLSSRPGSVPLKAMVGRLYLEAGDDERARKVAGELEASAPEAHETQELAGEVALAEGDALTAAEKFGRAAELRPSEASFISREVEALLAAGRLDKAERRLAEVLPSHPDEPGLIYAKARLAERRGELEESLSGYRRAASLVPSRELYHLAQGRAAEALGKTQEAEAAYKAALREGPGQLESYGALAGLLMEEGRHREVVFLLSSVVRWHPERLELGMTLAEAWVKEGYPERAQRVYKSLLASHAQGPRAGEIRQAMARLKEIAAKEQGREIEGESASQGK